ncbi:MAG TPA: methionine--tRNA ligase [Woeseiaceae bacterium]|nr:methionine--tRNA ligase [Woeseiaceae bacterium]|tara:strand:+ start:26632 stop:28629 length:1998 start_codon:yes stop_codon:yes gene_type:complete
MKEKERHILVSSALPYANGSIHMGHLVEYIQTDIWVRFQKMRGHNCHYVCAADAHGTPIMIKAREEQLTPEELVTKIAKEQHQDLKDFYVNFDNFHSTHSDENEKLVEQIYNSLKKENHIYTKNIEQAFDEKENMFLPDRFIKGTCPKCSSEDQYGDACEECGATYSPNDLINPISTISDAIPVWKKSEHFFFKLSVFENNLKKWIKNAELHKSITNKLSEWFDMGLKDWDISRDEPYFGFKIPGERKKYFYVWLDAPIGYLASFLNLANRKNLDFDAYLKPDSDHELYHFIGKDIVYFHTLFWPAVLEGAGFRKPTSVFAHGFLTINGKKMSKSRGTFVNARTYLNNLNPNFIRYYYAAKLGPSMEDIDLNADDFIARVNSDLIGKLVNIASRCSGFINKQFDNKLSESIDNQDLLNEFIEASDSIAKHYESREFSKAMRQIMLLADKANRYIEEKKPWLMIKDESQAHEVQKVCTQGLNLFRTLMIYLTPVIPSIADKSKKLFNEKKWEWNAISSPILSKKIQKYKPLLTRIDKEKVKKMMEIPKEESKNSKSQNNQISIDDFMKIDLRVALVVEAKEIKEAEKLLELTLDLDGELRTVIAGIKSAYKTEDLIGRNVVVVANLAPRKMRFGVSEGMVLAAGPGDSDIFLLSADKGATPGMKIK